MNIMHRGLSNKGWLVFQPFHAVTGNSREGIGVLRLKILSLFVLVVVSSPELAGRCREAVPSGRRRMVQRFVVTVHPC